MARHNDIGAIGENIAANFLRSKGLLINGRNYWKPYGEIDIVACENGITRFIEVKSVSHETDQDVSRGTYRPEENLHPQKLKRLSRVIQAYIISHETDEWVFDLICVYINKKTRSAQVKWIKDIVLEE